jgi:steroid delta-isomerase-like uncharacterized protein
MADLAKIAREAVDAFNASDWERTKALIAPDYLYNEVGTQRRIQGPEEVVAALQGWKQAMPDAKGTVTSALASGNTVALEIIWEGTHTGPLEGPTGTIPASGKRQVTPAAQILIFEGDKIKENHHYFDMMSLLKQIGALQ